MKNYKGYYIIGASIIIASILISLTLINKQSSSLEHCYQKVYKSKLERQITHLKEIERSRKEKGLPPYEKNSIQTTAEERAAIYARRECLNR